MHRKIFIFFVIMVLFFGVMGCGGKGPAAKVSPPKPNIAPDIAEIATQVLTSTEQEDWDKLYGYLHPDIQALITKEQFAKQMAEKKSHMKIKYENFALVKVKMLPEWQDPFESKMPYRNVAEVYYTVKVDTPKGEKEITNTLHLVKVNGDWKYLWSRI